MEQLAGIELGRASGRPTGLWDRWPQLQQKSAGATDVPEGESCRFSAKCRDFSCDRVTIATGYERSGSAAAADN